MTLTACEGRGLWNRARKEYTDGRLVSTGDSIASPLPTGLIAIPIDHQPGAGEKWDPVTRTVVVDAAARAILDKIARLDALRARGWANLAALEKTEAQGLGFDLGLYVPSA